MENWNNLDVKLYDHFNKTLWKRINDFGLDRMKAEIEILDKINTKNVRECVADYVPVIDLPAEFRDWEPDGVKIKGAKLLTNATESCNGFLTFFL